MRGSIFFKSVFVFIFCSGMLHAQFPQMGGNRFGADGRQMPAGRMYGKIVDAKTNKGIEFAAVQLFQEKRDSATKTMKESLVGGMLTSGNGDFSMDKVPLFGKLKFKASAIGYKTIEKEVSFDIKPGQGNMQQMLSALEKDLGNIGLEVLSINLSEVTIEGGTLALELKPDKKVYNVEKSQVATGGTAEDVMKNVPSVSVDLDGNVSLRNSSPQIFVDGRPTTLTLDQIPADAIESVEVITNPSAKYDASGGIAGILNIVLKKNRRIGYNGNLRAGADSRGRINGGADVNIREGKVNWFVSGNLNQRKSKGTTDTERENFGFYPRTNFEQHSISDNKGFFGMVRSGFDIFPDNRNTLTIAGQYHRGSFDPAEDISTFTDSLFADGTTSSSFSSRYSDSFRRFRNRGGNISFKHNFPKEGEELTLDVSYQGGKFNGGGDYITKYYNAAQSVLFNTVRQKQSNSSTNDFTTAQLDYSLSLNHKIKIEAGVRGAYRNYSGLYENYVFENIVNDFVLLPSQTTNYSFIDQVYAAYGTFSQQVNKFNYQAGIRVESSFYEGEQKITGKKFENDFPFSVFPSGFVSYRLSEKNDVQAGYSRRINRPTFFQLIPYTDYSDSLNLQRGNPDLTPEYTNSFELSHNFTLNRRNSVLTTLYYKNTTDLMTRYVISEFDTVLNRQSLITTFVNANSGRAYGGELTVQTSAAKWLDITANINVYQSEINGSNIESNLSNKQFSWFAKLNLNFKLPKNFSIQLSGDYKSKTALDQGGGGGRGFFSGTQSTAQGFVRPTLDVDAALKYEFMKNQAASITLNVSDVFKTRKTDTHYESVFYLQDSVRKRDAQVFRINFSYRFGKFDTSIFKRRMRNQNNMQDMMDMGGM